MELTKGVLSLSLSTNSVSCSYPNKNITIKIDENSSYPHYFAFVIYYQQGKRDITAVQLCEVVFTSLQITFTKLLPSHQYDKNEKQKEKITPR